MSSGALRYLKSEAQKSAIFKKGRERIQCVHLQIISGLNTKVSDTGNDRNVAERSRSNKIGKKLNKLHPDKKYKRVIQKIYVHSPYHFFEIVTEFPGHA